MDELSTTCTEATKTTTINGSGPSTHAPLPSYQDLRSSTQHRQRTASGDTSNCDRCNKNFIDKESLSIHLKYHHGDLVSMWMNPTEPRDELSQGQGEIASAETPLGELRDIHISDITDGESNAFSAAADASSLDLHLDSNGFDANLNDTLSNVEHLGMLTGNSFAQDQQEMQSMIPNPSPSMPYNYPSPIMPSPQGNVVPTGPSSTHSNAGGTYHPNSSQYYPEYTSLQTVSSMPQQSPGLQHPSMPQYTQSHYSTNSHHGGSADIQPVGFSEHYASQIHNVNTRFHPYGRSPSASPSVVKEEPKPAASDSQEILDLDTHRFLGSNAGAGAIDNQAADSQRFLGSNPGSIDNQATDRNQQLGYPHSMPQSTYPRNNTAFQSPREPGTIITSGMFGGGTVHSQRSPPMSEMGGGGYPYMPQSSMPPYHQQPYSSLPSVPSASPASSPSSQPGPQTGSDLPPSPSDFPTNVKRPKNFRCEVCLKWFTSQGHLKRHYNTNIHRNMLKQKEAKDAELAKANSMQPSPQDPPTPQSSQPTPTSGVNQYQQSPPENKSVVSPPLPSAGDSATTSSLLGNEIEDRKPQIDESAPSFPLQNNNAPSQPARPTPVPASSMFSSIASFQPGYSQPNFSQINTVQPQYASTPLYPADSSSLAPTSSSTTYFGHFSANPSPYEQASLSNNSSSTPPFFQAGSTPMTGGGFLHHNNNNSTSPNTLSSTSNSLPGHSHSQSISPRHISPLHPSGDYQSPEVHSTNECSMPIKEEFSEPFMSRSVSTADSHMAHHISSTGFSSENNGGLHAMDTLPSITEDREPSRVPARNNNATSPEGIISSSSPEVNRYSETGVTSPSAESLDSVISASGECPEPMVIDGIFHCKQCDMSFTKKCYYTQHFEKHLIKPDNYKCDKCGKKYNNKKIYDLHVSKHEGDKPYKCEVESCVKQFNHKTDLRRHMCLHTGEKPFKCNQCEKGFIRKDHMMKHMQTHKKKQATGLPAAAPRSLQITPPLPDSQVNNTYQQYSSMLQTGYPPGMLSMMPARGGQYTPFADFAAHPSSYHNLMQHQDPSLPTHHHHEVPSYVRVVDY